MTTSDIICRCLILRIVEDLASFAHLNHIAQIHISGEVRAANRLLHVMRYDCDGIVLFLDHGSALRSHLLIWGLVLMSAHQVATLQGASPHCERYIDAAADRLIKIDLIFFNLSFTSFHRADFFEVPIQRDRQAQI